MLTASLAFKPLPRRRFANEDLFLITVCVRARVCFCPPSLYIVKEANPSSHLHREPRRGEGPLSPCRGVAHEVGKTCLIKRYCEERFVPRYVGTVGVDYGVKKVTARLQPPPAHHPR